MRKGLMVFLNMLALLAIASVACAAEQGGAGISQVGSMIAIGTAAGMGIAASGCGIGQGIGLRGACEGIARNPDAGGQITVTMLIGMAMIESLAIYALVIDLILLFANPFV